MKLMARVLAGCVLAAAGLGSQSVSAEQPWRSTLYPEGWQAPDVDGPAFESDKLIQDFSYAGYMRGEKPLPRVEGPVFDVTDEAFGADASGEADSTAGIQAAIDAASSSGGGVVWLPAGTYRVSVGDGTAALSIRQSGVVLRGQGPDKTFILNTTTAMNRRSILEVAGPSDAAWRNPDAPAARITRDLPGAATIIPVDDVTLFEIGDCVVVRSDVTPEWVTEHNEPDWLGHEARLGGVIYHRVITAIDKPNNTVTIDIPTRYYLKTRDHARICKARDMIHDVGIEDLAIGNVEHPGQDGWGQVDYNKQGTSAWDTHAAAAINVLLARDSWIVNVHSFQAAQNSSTCHVLSNGIVATWTRGLTIRDCVMQRPQYGGGGGNGYMFRLSNCNEALVRDCVAEFNRHGLVLSGMGSSGNVFLRCVDRTTASMTGPSGYMRAGGASSDHHMHFSHSNLVDNCTGDGSWFHVGYRPHGTPPLHNLTAAHSVFWNTQGLGQGGVIVDSAQSRYGYVIGTRGTRTEVRTTSRAPEKTDPEDHVEGVGKGTTLAPASLYDDQLQRRLGRRAMDE